MKTLNHGVALLFITSLLLLACNKEPNPPISKSEMWNCHQKIIWDSLSIKERLIGEWEWEYIGCFETPNGANNDEFKGTTIEFKSDDTLNVKENGQITQTSSWKVVRLGSDLFELDTEPTVRLLYGRILFCDKRVEFNHSYIDGCDNYFKRKD